MYFRVPKIIDSFICRIRKIPPVSIKEVTPDFQWESSKIWRLDLPTVEMPIADLLWHFDFPFWEKEGTDAWNLTPWEFIQNPLVERAHNEKVQQADLKWPLEVIEYKGRYRILDGLHRLVKAYLSGQTKINVRIFPKEKFDEVKKRL